MTTISAYTLYKDQATSPSHSYGGMTAEGADHFVHFTELTKDLPYRPGSGGTPKAHPGEAKCKLEPLGKKATQTKVYSTKEDGTYRVTRVEVAGENVAHLF